MGQNMSHLFSRDLTMSLIMNCQGREVFRGDRTFPSKLRHTQREQTRDLPSKRRALLPHLLLNFTPSKPSKNARRAGPNSQASSSVILLQSRCSRSHAITSQASFHDKALRRPSVTDWPPFHRSSPRSCLPCASHPIGLFAHQSSSARG